MRLVLVDTSVWVEHFRNPNQTLIELLLHDQVKIHPFIIGELACGTPPDRRNTLALLENLAHVRQASISEAMVFIERERLYGQGCGLVDLLLLSSALMTEQTLIWTLDKRFGALAIRFNLMFMPVAH